MQTEKIICELCQLKFPNEMIVNDKELGVIQCYDCLFGMNSNDEDILNGKYGYDLNKYIEVSKKYHIELYDLPCFRLNDNGGCYVCMTLLDIPFERNIKPKKDTIPKKKDIIIKENKTDDEEDNIKILDNNFNISDNIILNL